MKPFHQWKSEQVERDSKANGVHRFYRPRDWYYQAYGQYVRKTRDEEARHQ